MVPRESPARRACAARAALVLLWMLPRHAGSFVSPAPARRRSTTHRAARDAPNGGAAPDAGSFIAPARRRCTSRRAAQDGPSDNAAPSRRAMLRRASPAPRPSSRRQRPRRGRDDWWGAEGILDWVANDKQQTAVASRVSSAYYSQEFVTYLSGSCSTRRAAPWWAAQAATVPPSYGERRRFEALAAAFESFSSSVEYGLRRYPGESGRAALLRSLASQHGDDPEKRRHLALAFTLLGGDRQPVEGIRALVAGVPVTGGAKRGSVGALLPPSFSPGLADYLERDPLALLPRTQLPVFDAASGAYEIRGLAPFVASGARGAATPFGKRGERGVGRERRLDPATYAGFALSGLVGCSATHAVLVPIDVVNAAPDGPGRCGVVGGGRAILREEGPGALFLGAEATLAGYCWYGLTVIFGMVKFFFFDSLADAIFEAAPALADGAGGRLAVSLVAGLVAGTASSLVSQPADAVLSRINADRGDLGVAGAVEAIWGEGHVRGFYRGAGALRVVRPRHLGPVRDLRRASRSPSRGRT
ncbi:hypothetical protein JL722_9136 [Aureococcus anophagefferens]|nr:hypothetical protein JL722_9136 [Aureococcus anophagefferens]